LLRPPKVYSTAHFRLSDNVENLILQGNADLQGYGNGLSNALYGNSGNNPDGFRSSNPTTPASQSVSSCYNFSKRDAWDFDADRRFKRLTLPKPD
jgi:hypothetical protein